MTTLNAETDVKMITYLIFLVDGWERLVTERSNSLVHVELARVGIKALHALATPLVHQLRQVVAPDLCHLRKDLASSGDCTKFLSAIQSFSLVR